MPQNEATEHKSKACNKPLIRIHDFNKHIEKSVDNQCARNVTKYAAMNPSLKISMSSVLNNGPIRLYDTCVTKDSQTVP